MAPIEPMLPADLAPEPSHLSISSSKNMRQSDDDNASMITMEEMSSTASAARRTASGSSSDRHAPNRRKLFNLPGVGVARRTLGLACLLITVFLWTVSNFLASSIFSDHTYDKPFFVVYANTAMFTLSLIPITIQYIQRTGGIAQTVAALRLAWREGSLRPLDPERMRMARQAGRDDYEDYTAGERLLAGDEETGLDGGDQLNKTASATTGARGGSPFGDDEDDGGNPKPGPTEKLGLRETARLSLEFCMLWFLANYLASACLQYTSVASVTILGSTSSVWTLILGSWLSVERFSWRKLVGVLASLAGILLISSVDLGSADNDDNRGNFPHKTQRQIAIGDAMALVSAVVYGIYVTVMKLRVGDEDRVSMPLFFGLVGCFNIVLLWPLFFILHFTGVETFEMPPTSQIWAVVLLNSVSSFVSDMSWAYAMLLTTPLIVTVGLSLTIPLSLIGEMIQYQQFSSFVYWIGAGVVLLSFLFINHESHDDGPAATGNPAEQSLDLSNNTGVRSDPGSGPATHSVLFAADQQDQDDEDDDEDRGRVSTSERPR